MAQQPDEVLDMRSLPGASHAKVPYRDYRNINGFRMKEVKVV
jgi:hypothetical protein